MSVGIPALLIAKGDWHLSLVTGGPELPASTCQAAPTCDEKEPISKAPPFSASSSSQTLSVTISAPPADLTPFVSIVPSAATVLLVGATLPPTSSSAISEASAVILKASASSESAPSPDSSSVNGLDPVQDKVVRFCRLQFV